MSDNTENKQTTRNNSNVAVIVSGDSKPLAHQHFFLAARPV